MGKQKNPTVLELGKRYLVKHAKPDNKYKSNQVFSIEVEEVSPSGVYWAETDSWRKMSDYLIVEELPPRNKAE